MPEYNNSSTACYLLTIWLGFQILLIGPYPLPFFSTIFCTQLLLYCREDMLTPTLPQAISFAPDQ